MKKKIGWILVVLAAVLAIATLGIRIWFISPGIHIFGKEIHVNLRQTCFIFDGETGELLDETTVTVEGATSREDPGMFDGDLKILGYQNSASGTVTALKAIETTEDGCWMITHMENCTHQETDANGITKPVEHFCDYSYTYYLYPEAPGELVVLIESFNEHKPMYAVCADNEEDAQVRYEEFMANRP